MAVTDTQLDQVESLLAAGSYDQVSAMFAANWPDLLLYFSARLLGTSPRVARVALAADDAAAGLFSWQNPLSTPVLAAVFLDVTTATSGACTADVGHAATEVLSDTLVDGLSLAAVGVFGSFEDQGANGRTWRNVPAGEYVTGSVASGASAGLAGTAVVQYVVVT